MTEKNILIFKKLKEQWAILKDEKSPKVDKRSSAKEIMKIQKALVDSKVEGFEPIDLSMTKYAEFLPVDYKSVSKVKWGDASDYLVPTELEKALEIVQNCEAQAVQITRELIPTEPVDSQKFGMIVSAKTDKILTAYYNEQKLKLYIKGK